MFSMDGKIGPRCGMLLSELAPDVESALDVENGPRLGTNPRSESNIYTLRVTPPPHLPPVNVPPLTIVMHNKIKIKQLLVSSKYHKYLRVTKTLII